MHELENMVRSRESEISALKVELGTVRQKLQEGRSRESEISALKVELGTVRQKLQEGRSRESEISALKVELGTVRQKLQEGRSRESEISESGTGDGQTETTGRCVEHSTNISNFCIAEILLIMFTIRPLTLYCKLFLFAAPLFPDLYYVSKCCKCKNTQSDLGCSFHIWELLISIFMCLYLLFVKCM